MSWGVIKGLVFENWAILMMMVISIFLCGVGIGLWDGKAFDGILMCSIVEFLIYVIGVFLMRNNYRKLEERLI